MIRNLLTLFTLGLSLGPSLSLGSEVRLLARTTHYSCSYYSTTLATAEVAFDDARLAGNSTVLLEYGFDGTEYSRPFAWDNRTVVQMTPGAPGHWSVRLPVTITERGSPRRVEKLSFRIRIGRLDQASSGPARGRSMGAFYRGTFPEGRCASTDTDDRAFTLVPLELVDSE